MLSLRTRARSAACTRSICAPAWPPAGCAKNQVQGSNQAVCALADAAPGTIEAQLFSDYVRCQQAQDVGLQCQQTSLQLWQEMGCGRACLQARPQPVVCQRQMSFWHLRICLA
jgi:hypothetical protein